MSYTAMFTQDTTPYDLNKNLPPKSPLKRNFTVFYDISATDDLQNIHEHATQWETWLTNQL